MDTIKIEEIASELGINKLSPETLFSLNIKSAKSTASVKVAGSNIDVVMSNRELTRVTHVPFSMMQKRAKYYK